MVNLNKSLEQKIELFKREKRTSYILENRTELLVDDFYDLGQALSERKSDQVIVYTGNPIIPPDFYSAQNFSKRGRLIVMSTLSGNQKKLKDEEWSEMKSRIKASENNKRENGPYIGWGWKDPESTWHVVRPTTVIEGHRLHQYASKVQDVGEKIKVYNIKDSGSNTISLKVPSRSSQKTHHVTLEHVPRLNNEKFVEWTRVKSRHDCDSKRNDFTFRFNGKITTYCAHDAAAYIGYSRRVAEATGEVIPQIFPMITEPFLRLFLGASNNMIIRETIREDGKKRTHSRIPSFAEIDPILMDSWLRYGNKQTCFVRHPSKQYQTGPAIEKRKRMRDYSWFDNNAPGIIFGDE